MSLIANALELALAGKPPSPELFQRLWEAEPDILGWLDRLPRGGDYFGSRRAVMTWLRAAARAAYPADHDAVIACEVAHLEVVPRDDGGFSDAQALYARRATPEIAGLVAKGAFTVRDYAAAEHYSRLAEDRRALAGALMHQRRWDEAFAILDDVLEDRGARGSELAVTRSGSDVQVSAIDEACTIAGWATPTVPEWVRALGVMWAAFRGEPVGEELQERFVAGLEALKSVDDFEVVIRQARERDCLAAMTLAAQIGCLQFRDDSWIHSVQGNLARDAGDHATALESYRRSAELLDAIGSPDRAFAWMNVGDAAAIAGDDAAADAAFARAGQLAEGDDLMKLDYFIARSLRERDPAAARARALAVFEQLARDPNQLAETELGFAATELALGLLLATRDRGALAVQQKLLDAKLALWGECPAVAMERHNLGTVHAQLGDAAKARELIVAARDQLLRRVPPEHPHVQLCERSLAKLSAS